MNGPEHYLEAEKLLQQSGETHDESAANWQVAKAQVHATLALAAATEQRAGFVISDSDVMRCAHGAVICGICGYGAPVGGVGR